VLQEPWNLTLCTEYLLIPVSSILRAYALGYLSAVTPKLISYARRLGARNWDTTQKLREVRFKSLFRFLEQLSSHAVMSLLPLSCAQITVFLSLRYTLQTNSESEPYSWLRF
jgi:hypothetical protein